MVAIATTTTARREQPSRVRRTAVSRPPTLWVVGNPVRLDALMRALSTLDVQLELADKLPCKLSNDDLGVVYDPSETRGLAADLERVVSKYSADRPFE